MKSIKEWSIPPEIQRQRFNAECDGAIDTAGLQVAQVAESFQWKLFRSQIETFDFWFRLLMEIQIDPMERYRSFIGVQGSFQLKVFTEKLFSEILSAECI